MTALPKTVTVCGVRLPLYGDAYLALYDDPDLTITVTRFGTVWQARLVGEFGQVRITANGDSPALAARALTRLCKRFGVAGKIGGRR
jgi:hypothetical protein